METRFRVLILLSLAVIASGCLHSNEPSTVTEGPESVVVETVSAEPPEIFSDQSVNVRLRAVNSGNIQAEVGVGELGERILRDYCPDMFSNSESGFSASTSTTTEDRRSYRLDPGERINVRWLLEQEGNVPIYNKRCSLKFAVPFNYSVQAFRQVQVKSSPEVEGSERLSSRSSSGPMIMSIRTLPGTTGKQSTYIATEDGDQYIEAMIELINKNPEEEYTKGLVDIDEKSLYVEASDPLELDEEYVRQEGGTDSVSDDSCGGCGEGEKCVYPEGSEIPTCRDVGDDNGLSWVSNEGDVKCDAPDQEIRLAQGRSVMIRCQIPVPEDLSGPANLSEIEAGVNYTYVKDAGERQVRVKSRE